MKPSVRVRRVLTRAGVLAAFGLSTLSVAGAQAATAYITNEKDNTVSVIDLDKLEVVKTVKVGQRQGVEQDRGHPAGPPGHSHHWSAPHRCPPQWKQ